MSHSQAPFYPIIYVRGYAMTESEQNQTSADPFNGFNLGSTVYRATPDKTLSAKKFIFESPILRLISDFGYTDVYKDGLDISDPAWSEPIGPKSIVIYRYYDDASTLLGNGKTQSILDFANGLNGLIKKVRELVCSHPDNAITKESFRLKTAVLN